MITIPQQLRNDEFKFIILKARDKTPLERDWTTTANYRWDNEKLQNHGGNVGIVTGFGNLLVIDFDNIEIQNDIIKKLPKTFTIKTGTGKLHKYFFCDDAESIKVLDNNKNSIADLQFTGRQVVTAPSTHPNGNDYVVLDDVPIVKRKFKDIKLLFGEWLISNNCKKKDVGVGARNEISETIKQKTSMPTILQKYGVDTSRNPTQCPLHTSKAGKCLSFNDTLAHCFHCEELSGDIFSVTQIMDKCDFMTARGKLAKISGVEIEEEREIWIKKFDDDGVLKSKKLIIPNIALNFLDCYKILTVGEEKFDMYYYNEKEGIYKKGAEKVINEYMQELTGGEVTTHHLKEIKGFIQRVSYADRDVLINNNLNLICVGNGILDISTLELKPFTSEQIFTQRIKWDYDIKVDCPKIKQFLKDILNDDDIPIIQEFIGYCLYREYFIKKAIIFNGERDTAKTTLIKLIVKFIGQENTSGVSLHKLLIDKFSSGSLKDKLLNFHDDLSFKDIKETGTFKIAVGSGYLPGEKKFKEEFSFLNYAKLLFATNKISCVEDADDMAYYDRWLLIFFENSFGIDNEKTDRHIIDKITSEEELKGLLNWAVVGLKRLLEQENFSYDKTAEDNKLLMEMNSDTISAFAQQFLVQKDGGWIAKEDLYKCYSEYVNEYRGVKYSDVKFSRRLPSKVKYIVETRKDVMVDGKRKNSVKGWSGVGLNTDFTDFFSIIYNKNIVVNIPINPLTTFNSSRDVKKQGKVGMKNDNYV